MGYFGVEGKEGKDRITTLWRLTIPNSLAFELIYFDCPKYAYIYEIVKCKVLIQTIKRITIRIMFGDGSLEAREVTKDSQIYFIKQYKTPMVYNLTLSVLLSTTQILKNSIQIFPSKFI